MYHKYSNIQLMVDIESYNRRRLIAFPVTFTIIIIALLQELPPWENPPVLSSFPRSTEEMFHRFSDMCWLQCQIKKRARDVCWLVSSICTGFYAEQRGF